MHHGRSIERLLFLGKSFALFGLWFSIGLGFLCMRDFGKALAAWIIVEHANLEDEVKAKRMFAFWVQNKVVHLEIEKLNWR